MCLAFDVAASEYCFLDVAPYSDGQCPVDYSSSSYYNGASDGPDAAEIAAIATPSAIGGALVLTAGVCCCVRARKRRNARRAAAAAGIDPRSTR